MQVYTHHWGPERLVGFVTLADSTFYNGEPEWFGPDTVDTAWIRKGLGKSHQYYLSGPQRTKETEAKPKADIMIPRWCKNVE